jgi:hypothetical protein
VVLDLADAVLAVLARDRDVSRAEAVAIERLASPADAVAEVQLDPPHGALAPVIGFAARGTRPLLDEPALGPWLDAVAMDASHWGIKLGAPRQVYARGRFEVSQAAAVAHASAADLERMLAATGAGAFAMLGVELDGDGIGRHIGYVAVTGARPAEALAAARGVAADLALLAPAQEALHLSWDLATATGPCKIDVGPRRIADAIAIATGLGLDGDALAARLSALRLGDPSHLGLRIGAAPARALALYFRITAS